MEFPVDFPENTSRSIYLRGVKKNNIWIPGTPIHIDCLCQPVGEEILVFVVRHLGKCIIGLFVLV